MYCLLVSAVAEALGRGQMVRKKVDDRVRTLIENSVKTHHRSLLVLVGDHGKAHGHLNVRRVDQTNRMRRIARGAYGVSL